MATILHLTTADAYALRCPLGGTFGWFVVLTHWGRVTHTCVSKLPIIGSDNGLSPGRRQAIIWTHVGILLIGPLATNFSEISIKIHTFSLKKIHMKMSSAKWRPSCLGLNVLTFVSDSINSSLLYLIPIFNIKMLVRIYNTISMAQCKTAIAPLLMHWRYHSLMSAKPLKSCLSATVSSLRKWNLMSDKLPF